MLFARDVIDDVEGNDGVDRFGLDLQFERAREHHLCLGHVLSCPPDLL